MALPETANFNWPMPEVNGSPGAWGSVLNDQTFAGIDTTVKAVKDTAEAALPKAGGALSGRLDALTSTEKVVNLGDRGVATELDLAAANIFAMRLTGAVAISIKAGSVPADGATVLFLKITNGGAHSISWPASFLFPDSVDAGVTANGTDVLGFITLDGGTTWLFCGSTQNLS